ncbi:MAG: putative glycerol-3-phosphate acyltransferase [Alphaproteobacteria bacterium MarineAlpha10_Bin2]|nr:MAG: putative glycerol-3-phosphate acyltransferase [Alphaproteobacteria bacterium MarineAlpha10_Bin2]
MPDPISWAYSWPYYAVALAAGYVLGSIPVGLLLARLFGHGDIRAIGSGNIGATNVLRTGNKPLAAVTLLLDGAKGAAAVLLAAIYGPDLALTAGFAAVIGHVAPVWLLFRGGKGVATSLGVLLAIDWRLGLIACAVWLAVAALFRYSSLASLVALVSAPGFGYLLAGRQLSELAAMLAAIVVLKHHGNIRRLVSGRESRIGDDKDKVSE